MVTQDCHQSSQKWLLIPKVILVSINPYKSEVCCHDFQKVSLYATSLCCYRRIYDLMIVVCGLQQAGIMVICLFVVRFNGPVNNFSVMMVRSHHFLSINQYSRELMCLAQGHNNVTQLGIKPRTS